MKMTKEPTKPTLNLSDGMSLQDYIDINELIREDWGFLKGEFYNIDEIPHYGIEPDRMMFTHYFPDGPSWFGDICIVLHGEIDNITILLKDGQMKHGCIEGWRLVKDVELPMEETYSDKRYEKLT